MKKTNRQLQKEQTKELLLKTAYDLFSSQGFMNTRISDIAQAAGVSHGTVFVHFKTQDALITEVIQTYGKKIALRTHELADSCENIRDILSSHLAGIEEFEPFYTRLVTENRLLPPAAQDVWLSIQSAVSFHFSQVAEREMAAGSIARIPDSFLFNLWIGLVHYYLVNGNLFSPEGSVIRRYGDLWITDFMKLLKPTQHPGK